MHDLDRATRIFARGPNKSPAPPRRHLWAIAFALPLTLMTLLWAAATYDLPIASAASATTYAGCPSLSPNFSTIQQAVSNTAPGGVVNICPGNYNESVNLSLMNGGGGTGNITVRKEPSVAGIVDWTNTAVGLPAIQAGGAFSGNIVLQDLYVHDVNAMGINLVGVSGSVVMSNVQSYRNHTAAFGVFIVATQGITIVNSSANENPVYGFHLLGVPGAPPIHLENVQANDNGLSGIFIPAAEAVDIIDSEANHNGTPLAIAPTNAGIYILASNSLTQCGSVESGGPSINIENTETSHNFGYGISINSPSAPVFITGVTADDNALDGVAAVAGDDACYPSSIEVVDSNADQNGWYYLQVTQAGGDVEAESVFGGPYAGFALAADQITVDGASATENQDRGLCLNAYSFGKATVINSNAENNAYDGILYDSTSSCGGVLVDGLGEEVVVQGAILTPGSVVISNTTASDNPGNGVEVMNESTVVTISNLTAQANGTGVLLNYEALALKGELVINIPSPTYMPVRIDNSLIQSNTDSGIAFEEYIFPSAPLTTTVPATIVSNIICENGAGLVVNRLQPAGEIAPATSPPNITIATDARGNWWGDKSGPTPPGTGDTIISGTGVISATPWIDTFFTDTVPSQTIVGIPVEAAFRFGDANGAYFLENGVGNLNESPIFHISSDNGDISAAASIDQFLEDTYLSVMVTPTVTGLVNVNVTGPCGLTPSIAVPVAEPSISVSKSPDLQGVPVGGAAAFTVTIANTGDITLTEIAVTDTLAPSCARTSGAIDDLGPGEQYDYPCTLSPINTSLVNTVQVDAKALVGGEPAGSGVSDSDTASVKVGSLTLTRTVWVDGFNPACQTIDKSLTMVPSGTTVKYCFTVTNSGDYTFTTHSLNDSRLGAIFGGFAHDLPPGASYSNIDAGFPATETVTANITGVTTWTGTLDGPIVELTPVSVAAVAQDQVATTVSRAVALSQTGDDQDNDGIDDITEGYGDVNANGVPDFLEFTPPTGEPEEGQPGLPQTLLLPSLTR